MDQMQKFDVDVRDYVGYSKNEKIFYYDYCISEYAYFHVVNPTYLGCFLDTKQRDLQTLIGEGLTKRECFNKAKEAGHTFVSLQNGRECWADKRIGIYPRVSEIECRKKCEKDDGNCGGEMRNAIFDIRDY